MAEDEQKVPRGQPPHKPTAAKRENVRRWKAAGISENVISVKLGISHMTLRAHYAEDLTYARDMKKADLLQMAYKSAEKGSVAAIRLIGEMIIKAELKDIGKHYGDDDEPRIPAKLGKKEAAQIEAEKAGVGSEWGNDLMPGASKVN